MRTPSTVATDYKEEELNEDSVDDEMKVSFNVTSVDTDYKEEKLNEDSVDSDMEAAFNVISRPDLSAMAMSVGSLGHPFSCDLPCKYVSKARGCKDSRFCVRCHLCGWKGQTVHI